MKTSENGKKFISEREDIKLHVYKDIAGNETIGIGHLITPAEKHIGKILIGNYLVNYKNGITEDQCYKLLAQDLEPAEEAVNEYVKVPLTQDRFDALVDFCFNCGATAFKNSTLLKVLNDGKYEKVPDQLMRWNKSGGIESKGLTNRRIKEIELWRS